MYDMRHSGFRIWARENVQSEVYCRGPGKGIQGYDRSKRCWAGPFASLL